MGFEGKLKKKKKKNMLYWNLTYLISIVMLAYTKYY